MYKYTSRTSGFSLIELTVVVAMVAMLGVFGLYLSTQNYGGHSLHTTRQLVVATLQKARSDAMANMCEGDTCTGGLPHGVHISKESLVLFQGAMYNPVDAYNTYIPLDSPGITFSGLHNVVFAQLNAQVVEPGDVILTSASGGTSTISIGSEGQISWSK